jgi:hypothetical protein
VEWAPETSGSPMRLDNGNGLEVKLPYILDLKGTPPVFEKGYLAVKCVKTVAR